MLALSQPSPNDDSRNGRLFEHPACGNIGNGHTVLASNLVQGRQNRLESRPPSDGVDEALVLRLAPVLNGHWLGRTHPAVRQEAAPECSVGQQAHAGGETESTHVLRGATVEKVMPTARFATMNSNAKHNSNGTLPTIGTPKTSLAATRINVIWT